MEEKNSEAISFEQKIPNLDLYRDGNEMYL